MVREMPGGCPPQELAPQEPFPSVAQRFYLIGRFLQVRPTPEAIDAFVAAYPGFEAPDAQAVADDNLRLFVGLGMPIAPLWESTWASDARLLFQRQTLDVRYWYRSAGLQVAALHREPDDHLGLELEFIGTLLDRGDRNTAVAFAQEHPCAWVARWNEAVQRHAATPFYRHLAAEAASLLALLDERG